MKFKLVMVVLVVLLATAAYAQIMDTLVGENIVNHESVLQGQWASLTVSPSTAYSLPKVRNFTQTITLCNKAEDSGYLYLDYYFDKPLTYSNLVRWDKWVEHKQVDTPILDCKDTGKSPDNQTVCTDTGQVETHYQDLWHELKTPISGVEQTEWGEKANYVKKSGELFQAGECKDYVLNYQPAWGSNEGKWNLKVWGNIVDDWSCVADEKCPYSYTLDPTFSTAFTYKKNINITNNGRSINNYTVFLNFTSSTLDTTHVQADGDDVIFVNQDETTQLGCYKESFDPTGVMNWSVMLPNFSNSTATSVWMYYGNSSMANQCPEINNAYLLADLMNSTSINTTIWNQYVGTFWGATTKGYYQANTSVAVFCQQWATTASNSVECNVFGNASGVYKSSQNVKIEAMINFTSKAGCGYGFGWGNYSGITQSRTLGNQNNTWYMNDGLNVHVQQNGTELNSVAVVSSNAIRNVSLESLTGSYQSVLEWRNNTNPGTPMGLIMSTSKGSANILNETHNIGFGVEDGSGGVACQIDLHEIRVRGDNNETPSISLGTEQNVSNPPIALSVSNETWETGSAGQRLYDFGGISNYSINVTIDQNAYNNISAVNFSINGVTYRDSQIQNVSGGIGQTNWTVFNISVYTPAVQTNGSTVSFNWSFAEQSNSTGAMGNSSNRTQTVTFGWEVGNFTYISPVESGQMNNIYVNFTKHVPTRPTMFYNVTLEWNQSNYTRTVIALNTSGSETWNVTLITPNVLTTTTVQMKGWLNLSFNGSFVLRDPNASQVIVPISVNATQFWEDPVNELNLANYSIAVNWSGNSVNNLTNVNFTYNNSVFVGGITNVTVNVGSNIYQTTFTTTLRPNLTQTYSDNYTFQWNFTVDTNASNISTSANAQNQTVHLIFNASNVTWQSPVAEATSNGFIIYSTNPICEGGVEVFPTATATIEYNGTNQSQVSPQIHIDCSNPLQFGTMTMTSPSVNSAVYVPFIAWVNYTAQGVQRNRNFTNQTQLVVDEGAINNETYNTPVFETSIANFTMNITNISVSVLNVNFTWNATVYNGTNITNSSSGNTTLFNLSIRLPLVPANQTNHTFQWNYTLSTTENKSSNLTNQTVLWAWYPNKLDLTPDLYELFPQTAGVNVTKHLFVNGVVDSVNIEYNQSNKSTTLTSNQTNWEDWNVTFTTPPVSSDLSVQARGILNISFLGTTYLRNTTNSSQLIRNINLSCGKCFNTTSNFTAVLNFSFFDEFSNASLAENGSDSITIWTTLQSVNQTFGCNFVNSTFTELCVQNMNTNFTANFNVQYGTNSSGLYPIRELWKRNQQIANQTMNYSLYNILSVNASEVVITVQDAARVALQNEIVEAYKYNISNNSFMLVDSGFTDFDGKTRLQLYRQDDYYKFIVRDGSGTNVLETSMFKLLFTEYFLIVNPTNQTTIQTVIQIRAIERNLTWDNGTKLFALAYLDRNNVSDNYCLEIVNTTAFNMTILNKQCSSNRSGSFSYNLGNVNGTYQGRFVVGTGSFLVDVVDAILNIFRTLGKDAYFGSFILVGTISAAGFFVNPSVGFALLAMGMSGLYWMQLIPIGWIGFASIISVIVITGLVVRKSL